MYYKLYNKELFERIKFQLNDIPVETYKNGLFATASFKEITIFDISVVKNMNHTTIFRYCDGKTKAINIHYYEILSEYLPNELKEKYRKEFKRVNFLNDNLDWDLYKEDLNNGIMMLCEIDFFKDKDKFIWE